MICLISQQHIIGTVRISATYLIHLHSAKEFIVVVQVIGSRWTFTESKDYHRFNLSRYLTMTDERFCFELHAKTCSSCEMEISLMTGTDKTIQTETIPPKSSFRVRNIKESFRSHCYVNGYELIPRIYSTKNYRENYRFADLQ